MKTQTTNNRVQSNGWSTGLLTEKKRTSINLDSDIGRMIEMRSKETGLFISRIINDSLRQHFGMVIKWSENEVLHLSKKVIHSRSFVLWHKCVGLHLSSSVLIRMFVPDSNIINTNKPVVGSSPSLFI